MAVPWEAVLVTALIGVAFTAGAGFRLWRERALRAGGVKTHALVVDQDEHYDVAGGGFGAHNRSPDPGRRTKKPWSVSTANRRRGLVQAPIVEFTTAAGQTVRTRPKVSSNASSVVPGRTVTVFYDPAQPQEVAIAGYGRGVLFLFFGIGVLVLALTVVLLVAKEETLASAAPFAAPIVLGSACLGVGGFGIGRVWTLRRRGIVAEGLVVGESTSSTREGLTLRRPVVRFTLQTGHEVQTASERGSLHRRAPNPASKSSCATTPTIPIACCWSATAPGRSSGSSPWWESPC
ncbi:DUF3592 domain-containing protein [Phytoactinopolyspora mesophila]|uniref:DUF3592 domain-containing protein n=1 Tax=Phytoactinopolyspora mesophila TaxID=2650750 RepID=A0A7K3LY29_9ACTN|nr:DUF3592 domain-containing protein [Phytoactinopolyspora mesophila]NDL55915.1 DUF3592 domain-containing protein [Phytoactinopolyspora mesophila]